ncbi:MAG: squalene-hopene/tetraprenyl-beta-curcumene cyclase [Rhodothermales bacterium]|jgi:squalene-hopene/tetraprenyl-beta-curcumene cyclase
MKLATALLILFANSAFAQLSVGMDISLLLEGRTARIRGAQYLRSSQTKYGGWTQHAGVTAMCVWALHLSDNLPDEQWLPAREKAREFILSHHRNEGVFRSVASDETLVYSTSACIIALRLIDHPDDLALADQARDQLIRKQALLWAGATPASYGSAKVFPYLTNTHWALEAVRANEDPERSHAQLQFWGRATAFLDRCQAMHLPEDNPDFGCFSYSPTFSVNSGEPWALGSFTAAGIKCLLYAGVPASDPRVTAALTWLERNFSVKDNPNAGSAGYYNYIYMLSTLMTLLQGDPVLTPYPRLQDWRENVVEELLNRQRGGGEWQNTNRMWREQDANLCTAYALLAMSLALPE